MIEPGSPAGNPDGVTEAGGMSAGPPTGPPKSRATPGLILPRRSYTGQRQRGSRLTHRRRAHLGHCRRGGKRRFRDQREATRALQAAEAARQIAEAEGRPCPRRERRAYFCDGCRGWHLTSQPERGTEPLALPTMPGLVTEPQSGPRVAPWPAAAGTALATLYRLEAGASPATSPGDNKTPGTGTPAPSSLLGQRWSA